jgi:hypothetical protein
MDYSCGIGESCTFLISSTSTEVIAEQLTLMNIQMGYALGLMVFALAVYAGYKIA